MNQPQPMEALAAANAATVDAVRSLAFASIKATERLMSLNLGFARNSLQLGAECIRPGANWQQMLSQQNSGFQKSAAEAADYLRGVYDISTEAQADMNEVISSRVGNIGETMESVLEVMARSAPRGSEQTMDMIRSAFASTCSAYAQVVRNVPQAANGGQPARKTRRGQ